MMHSVVPEAGMLAGLAV